MIVKHFEKANAFLFKAGPRRKTQFLYLFSDFSAFGDPIKKPVKFRGNYRKTIKFLLENELNELTVRVQDGDYLEVLNPVFSRERTAKEIKEYHQAYKNGKVKADLAKLDVTITLPAGNAIKIYSIKDSYMIYIVNDGKKIFTTDDFALVEEITDVYF
jgi:hypothetical protein